MEEAVELGRDLNKLIAKHGGTIAEAKVRILQFEDSLKNKTANSIALQTTILETIQLVSKHSQQKKRRLLLWRQIIIQFKLKETLRK